MSRVNFFIFGRDATAVGVEALKIPSLMMGTGFFIGLVQSGYVRASKSSPQRFSQRLQRWLLWGLLTAVAFPTSIWLCATALSALLRLPDRWTSFTELNLGQIALCGALAGAIIGLLQWPLLRRHEIGLRQWLLASSAGWMLSLLVGAFLLAVERANFG